MPLHITDPKLDVKDDKIYLDGFYVADLKPPEVLGHSEHHRLKELLTDLFHGKITFTTEF